MGFLTEEEMRDISALEGKEYYSTVEKLTPEQRKQFDDYVTKKYRDRREEREKERRLFDVKKALIRFGVFIAILIVEFTIIYFVQSNKMNQQCIEIFKNNACQHGICVDNQWFRTADELTEYVKKHYTDFHFYVFFYTYGFNEFQYYYHPNGL